MYARLERMLNALYEHYSLDLDLLGVQLDNFSFSHSHAIIKMPKLLLKNVRKGNLNTV